MPGKGNVANLRPPWKPGESGNPGGRPAGIRAKTRELIGESGEVALEILRCAMLRQPYQGKKVTKEQMMAAERLLDRGFGKPVVQTEVRQLQPLEIVPPREEEE